jgi:hypothetical protein
LIWLLVIGSLSTGGVLVAPIVSGASSPPRFARDVALRSVEEARTARAEIWAPESLAVAETYLKRGREEYRRQEVRFASFRRFALTKAWFARAEATAKRASAFSRAEAESARTDAEVAIAQSQRLVDVGHAFASVVPLQRIERRRLADSKVSLAEAHVLFREGSYLEAASRARSIQDLVQGVVEACSSKAGRYADRSLIQKWRTMIDDTIDWSRQTGQAALVVLKAEHKMTLYVGGKAIRTYRTDIGFNNVADKLVAGDGATPEGRYRITEKKSSSTYYKALLLNYPNEEDERQLRSAKEAGRIARSAGPGGLIEIHGEGGRGDDWTKGCVAVSNREMDDLFGRVGVGTPVTIVGSDGDGGLFVHLMRQHESVMSANQQ